MTTALRELSFPGNACQPNLSILCKRRAPTPTAYAPVGISNTVPVLKNAVPCWRDPQAAVLCYQPMNPDWVTSKEHGWALFR